jgi:MinD superfamily P-loop ATPase
MQRTMVRTITVRAPALAPLVELWLRLSEVPNDRRAYIQLRLLEKEGVDRCPRCQSQLSVDGYSITSAPYSRTERLTCAGCQTDYILSETHCA